VNAMKSSTSSSHFRGILILAVLSFVLAYFAVAATTYLPGHEPSFLFSILLSAFGGLFILLVILLPYYLCRLLLNFLKRERKNNE